MYHWTFSLLSHWSGQNQMAINSEANDVEKCSHLDGWQIFSPKTWDAVNKEEWKSRYEEATSYLCHYHELVFLAHRCGNHY